VTIQDQDGKLIIGLVKNGKLINKKYKMANNKLKEVLRKLVKEAINEKKLNELDLPTDNWKKFEEIYQQGYTNGYKDATIGKPNKYK